MTHGSLLKWCPFKRVNNMKFRLVESIDENTLEVVDDTEKVEDNAPTEEETKDDKIDKAQKNISVKVTENS